MKDAAKAEKAKGTVSLARGRRAAILKALSDPNRFELLELVARSERPLGCTQARATLPISAATLSHHIKELESAGLIRVHREGKFAFLVLCPGVLQSLAQILAALEQPSGPASAPPAR
jgi:ArsR family transcriptional regulator, arsenate/arsenite/antimonite-responsive transcriptional repressor